MIGFLGFIILLNLQTFALVLAALLSEQRPDLLKDANWNDPASAKSFNARFPAGSPTSALEDWLRANKFEIDAAGGRANSFVSGFPCSEAIEVDWSSTQDGKLTAAKAVIPSGSCL